MVIRQDAISLGLTAISVALLIFLSTFGSVIMGISVFVAFIGIASLVLNQFLKQHAEDPDIEGGEWRGLIIYSVAAFFAIVVLNLFVPKLPLAFASGLTGLQGTQLDFVRRSMALLIAVAEEQFFRAFIANLLINRLGPALGILFSGAFFGIYHLNVYGSSVSTLMIVVGAGMILTFAAWRTGRLSTSLIPHLTNNLLSV